MGQRGRPRALADPKKLFREKWAEGTVLTCRVKGATSGNVWGSGPYSIDSNLAAAAVQAGTVKPGETGTVTVEVIASPEACDGTTANGVTSLGFGAWPPGAFKFVK